MASAAISAGASILGGIAGGKGAAKAAKIQSKAYQAGIDEQRRQFNIVQGNNQPYMAAGTESLASLLDLLGLGTGGSTAQGSAIDSLKASPAFTSRFDAGQDAILQSAAATGGLRGGNTQSSLAQFGSGLLSDVIQQRLSQLGGLMSTGQAAATGTNSAALATGNNVSNLLGQQGGANAMRAAAPYAAFQSTLAGLNMASGPTGASATSGYTPNMALTAPTQISTLSGYDGGFKW